MHETQVIDSGGFFACGTLRDERMADNFMIHKSVNQSP